MNNDGFWLAKNFFSKQIILSIKSEMEDIFRATSEKEVNDLFLMELFKTDLDMFIGCANLCQKLPSVYSLASSNLLMEELKNKGGIQFPVFNTKPLVSFSSKNTAKNDSYWKIEAHQDWSSNLGSTNGITCWMPLQNVDDNLGPLEVAPRSHLLGPLKHVSTPPVLQHEADSLFNFKAIPMDIGDVLFFHTMLVHKSGFNKTDDRIRWSMHFRYNDAYEASFIERKYPRNRTNE